jgi:sulfur carrier protein ThiS
MKVKISAFGSVAFEGVDEQGCLEIGENTTVKQVLKRLPLEKPLRKHVPVVVNGELVKRSYKLQEGDELTVVLPTGGG